MRRILLFVYLLLAAFTATNARAALHGSWPASEASDHSIQLSLVREHSTFGHTFELSSFTGLGADQLHAGGDKPVKFSLARDAGTIVLEGIFGDGEGGGRFTFNANPGYTNELRSMNVTWSDDMDDERLFMLAALDVSKPFIRDMQSLGYRTSLEDYTRFRIHGASPEYVREMQTLGYRDLSSEDLVRFRIHGVHADYVRSLNEYGYHPSAEDIVRFRIHGVSAELVKTLTSLGYKNISGEDLVRFKIHGVSSEYVRDLKELGYTPNPEDFLNMRIHGVSIEYIRDLKALGYKPSTEDLVRMRIHGVSIDFIRSIKDAGYSGVPVDKLIEMRIHGLDARYLKAMNP